MMMNAAANDATITMITRTMTIAITTVRIKVRTKIITNILSYH